MSVLMLGRMTSRMNEHEPMELEKEMFNSKPKYIQERWKDLAKAVKKSPYLLPRKRVLGIITDVRFGLTGRSEDLLGLVLEITDGSWHVMNILSVEQTRDLLLDLSIDDVQKLLGTGIWLLRDGNRMLWLEPAKIELHKKGIQK
jgi:hypothetical protein